MISPGGIGQNGFSVPPSFAGVCVTFDGVKAPIFGVAPTQITVAVPTLAPGTVAVQVLRNCATAGELKSNLLNVTAQAASPEFLYLETNADGVNPAAAVGADGGFSASTAPPPQRAIFWWSTPSASAPPTRRRQTAFRRLVPLPSRSGSASPSAASRWRSRTFFTPASVPRKSGCIR